MRNEIREALLRLEECCEKLADTRTQQVYLAMIDSGQEDALLELDRARKAARAALAAPASAAEPVANANRYRTNEDNIQAEAEWLVGQINWKSPNPEEMKIRIGTHLSAKIAGKSITIDT